MGELGTFKLANGDLVRCRVDRSGRLAAYREINGTLVACDLRVLLLAVKLSDDPDWLREPEPAFGGVAAGD
jgi:hypothetical protein